MRKATLILVFAALTIAVSVGAFRSRQATASPLDRLKAQYTRRHVSSVDHAALAALRQPFTSPRDVTTACLSCHTERGKEVMASSHWNWTRREYIPGRGIHTVGKKNILNNFCIGVSSNLEGCDSCHAGYGLVDSLFDFTDPQNIDCLACHDTTNTYAKSRGGLPAASVDLRTVAQHVGRPSRNNCGTCHFFGGGGNNVKHGDLEEALFEPARDLDVHMAVDGANAQFARGCTSGAALSGMAVMSFGGILTMLAIFGSAYAVAYFFRSLWVPTEEQEWAPSSRI